jgi:CRISPR/Cas system CMR-associated protein Cmr5 small subunit
MITLIGLYLYFNFDYDYLEKILKKFKKYINHKIKIIRQNEEYRKAKAEQRARFEKEKIQIRRDTEIKLQKIKDIKEREIKEIETKYNKLYFQLDTIKDQNGLIEFLSKFNE